LGIFNEFINYSSVRLTGFEAGRKEIAKEEHAPTLIKGCVGVVHSTMSYLKVSVRAEY